MTKLHELVGQITNKELRKVYNKSSPYHGNLCYKLRTLSEDKNKEEVIFIYPNLVSKQIFQTIAQSHYIDKRYLFFCEKKPKRWVLHHWEELASPEKSVNQEPELTTHD